MRAGLFSWGGRWWRIRGGGGLGSSSRKSKVSRRFAGDGGGGGAGLETGGGLLVVGRTYAWELDAAVTALGWAALLLGVLVLELSAWSLDDSNFVRAGVVTRMLPSANPPACTEPSRS